MLFRSYIQAISDEWVELHGDRRSGKDDLALVGGIARFQEIGRASCRERV